RVIFRLRGRRIAVPRTTPGTPGPARSIGREGLMRRVRYSVAASLDGYIAGSNGEYDWIVTDPAIDFRALFASFDTMLIGRKTYEMMVAQGPGGGGDPWGMKTFVFSRTMRAEGARGVTVVADGAAEVVAGLKRE